MISRRGILKMLGLAPIMPALAVIPIDGNAQHGAISLFKFVGEKESAGSLIYEGTWGRVSMVQRDYLTRVYVISDYPVHDRVIMLLNAEEKTT